VLTSPTWLVLERLLDRLLERSAGWENVYSHTSRLFLPSLDVDDQIAIQQILESVSSKACPSDELKVQTETIINYASIITEVSYAAELWPICSLYVTLEGIGSIPQTGSYAAIGGRDQRVNYAVKHSADRCLDSILIISLAPLKPIFSSGDRCMLPSSLKAVNDISRRANAMHSLDPGVSRVERNRDRRGLPL
jgi:hypothetical protein